MFNLVLLPGLDGTGRLFSPFIRSLGPEFNSTVVTYPGNLALDYDELQSVAESFLPRDEQFILLAESFSGPVAISLASARPAGLIALILCCSFARCPRPTITRILNRLPLGRVKATANPLLAKVLLGRSSSPQLTANLKESLSEVSSKVLRARLTAVSTVDVSAKLKRLQLPILYLRAMQDRVVTRASFEQVLKAAPHTKLAAIPGPHLLLQAAPSEAAVVVRDFADNVRSHLRTSVDDSQS